MNRNLDGIYFRIKRDGKWGNVCFSDLTDDEMNHVMQNRSEEWYKRMCIYLGHRIKEIGDELDLMCRDEE
jgi:hypothetical protein